MSDAMIVPPFLPFVERSPIRWVLIRDPKGKFKSQALLCTDRQATPKQIIEWFVMRWQLESRCRKRAHLGVRHNAMWSDRPLLAPTGSAGFVFAGDLAGSSLYSSPETAHPSVGVVSQGRADLFRCIGRGPLHILAPFEFSNIGIPVQHHKNARCFAHSLC
jgi:hypothetical protein